MEPQGGKKDKSPGQLNDSFGSLLGSQEAQSSRISSKEDEKI